MRHDWTILGLGLLALLEGCGARPNDIGSAGAPVVLDTSTPLAEAQQAANAAFAQNYVAQCTASGQNPTVLLTGFGHFMDITQNPTGLMVQSLVPAAMYPATAAPAGQVEDPSTQTSVAVSTLTLPGVGQVDVCAMIVPVYWDLAAILIAKEIDSFGPSFVMMNGVADATQPLWLELGSVNEAQIDPDGSQNLSPAADAGDAGALPPLVPTASAADFARPLLASWSSIQNGALGAIQTESAVPSDDGTTTFGAVVTGALFAGFPRDNTYLCNDTTYLVNYLMDYPGQSVELMQPSTGGPGVSIALQNNASAVPREFVHWPTTLSGSLVTAGAQVMEAIMAAQLSSLASGDTPTRGDNSMADPSLAPTGP
jgi:hypothetical protein